jgi:hypothetical protein
MSVFVARDATTGEEGRLEIVAGIITGVSGWLAAGRMHERVETERNSGRTSVTIPARAWTRRGSRLARDVRRLEA